MKLKKGLKKLIPFSFAFFLLLIAIIVPTEYSVTSPGELTAVESSIKIDGVENSTNFYTTSVYYSTRASALFRMVMELDNRNEVERMTTYEKSISLNDDYLMGQLSKRYSYYSSLVNAYSEASKIDSTISIDYEIDSLLLYYRPSKLSSLNIGDEIISIDGQLITKNNYLDVIQEARKPQIELTIKRDEKLFNQTVIYQKGDYYLGFFPNIKIISSTPTFTLPGLNTLTGGPSGGLMQTLNIYASLLKLNFDNLKIAGTGTLNLEGTVGAIGGAVQKIHTANKRKADIFFMAYDNHNEVISIDKKFKYYPVKTFAEAVAILMGLN